MSQRLFRVTRDGTTMVLTTEQVLEELRTDLDEADPGDEIKFPTVKGVVMTEEEYETLAESTGW